jgi:cell division protein FtsL
MTAKKNTTTQYAPDMSQQEMDTTQPQPQKSLFNLSTAQQVIQLAITIASVVIVLAGLWLASALSPIVQDIALVKQAAADQDTRIEDMKTDITQIKNDTSETRTDVATIKGILQAVK